MRFRIKYIDYHWDNYQGASGKSFEMHFGLSVPNNVEIGNLKEYICNALLMHVNEQRVFKNQDNKPSIISIEIV